MITEVLPDGAVALRAAAVIAAEARAAVAARGRFVFGVSGGRTAGLMLSALADQQLPWSGIHLFQVDERVAPPGHEDRNLTRILQSLESRPGLEAAHVHPMPVDDGDLGAAVARYADELHELAGSPPVLDLVHLGVGLDGHTASLFPGDPVLAVTDADVAPTASAHAGRRRMTLTYPVLNRARFRLWVVTGSDKAAVVARLRAGDASIPAGRVSRDRALLLVDAAAGAAAARR